MRMRAVAVIGAASLGLAADLAGLGGASSAWAAGGQVDIEHAAARVVVLPEPRSNLSVTVQQGDPRLPRITVRQDGPNIILEGGLEHRIQGCPGSNGRGRIGSLQFSLDTRSVRIRGIGLIKVSQLPVVTAHVPLRARVTVGEAVWGRIGDTASLDFADLGCGDWEIGDVGGPFDVSVAGSGDVRAGSAQSVKARLTGSGDLDLGAVGAGAVLDLAGSGDMHVGAVKGALRATLAGSGDISVASVDGPLHASLASSGDVTIYGGRSPDVGVAIAGSGSFTFKGEAAALSASVIGSGDVTVAHVSGPVSKSIMGSGEINTGR